MKRIVAMTVGVLALSTSVWAQGGRGAAPPPPPLEAGASQADVDAALLAAPANLAGQATVIKWKPDYTYTTLRKGTNRLVCYDRSGQVGQQPFSIECTSLGNLERVAQNIRFEAMGDKKQAALDAAEKDGSRVKPEYGSIFYNLSGPDRASARGGTCKAQRRREATQAGNPRDAGHGGAREAPPGARLHPRTVQEPRREG